MITVDREVVQKIENVLPDNCCVLIFQDDGKGQLISGAASKWDSDKKQEEHSAHLMLLGMVELFASEQPKLQRLGQERVKRLTAEGILKAMPEESKSNVVDMSSRTTKRLSEELVAE